MMSETEFAGDGAAGIETRFSSGVYKKREITIVRGAGARVWDSEGKEYVDCNAGHGVAVVGHCNEAVVRAVSEQAARLMTCSETFCNDVRAELLSHLASVMPGDLDRFFLCNSGTEAVEAALKFARLATGRTGFIATMRGFHGRSMGSLSATWEPKYRRPFEPLVPGFSHVPFGSTAALEEAVGPDTAAVILEPVQGEGGVHAAEPEYLRRVSEICGENGALFVVDEVQTGFGRTGRMFAIEHSGAVPDIMCMAKGLGGGIPVGAVALGSRVGPIPTSVHGSTFGGNPVACAAALATLGFIRDADLPGRAAKLGEYFVARLKSIRSPLIRDVRGIGLMVGVELKQRSGPAIQALMDRGVLALAAGATVVRFLPPLVVDAGDLDFVANALEEVLATVYA